MSRMIVSQRKTRSNAHLTMLALGLGLGLADAMPALALEARVDDGIADITVTAQRRSESAQNVGIALTVISPETLLERGVSTVNDLEYLVPAFQATPQFGSGQPGYRIRGVGFDDYASNNSPTVGIYVDDVAYPIPLMTQGTLFDVARVEVLRGPQGTLYGRNTTGGAINFLTNKPTDHFTIGGDFSFGRYDEARLDAYVSGPVGDRVRIRLAGTTQQGGAWQHNRDTGESLGDKDSGAVRLITDIDVTDDLKAEITVHGAVDKSDQLGLYLITPLTAGRIFTPADIDHTAVGWGTSPSFAHELHIDPGQKPFRDNEGWGIDGHVDWRLSFAVLSDIASYEGFDRREYDNYDGSSEPNADVYYNSRAAVYANELRLHSLDDAGLEWTAGLYYSREHLNEVYRSGFVDSFGGDAYTPYTQDAETESAFGQVTPKLTDTVSADLGLRIEHEQRVLKNLNTFFIVPVLNLTIPLTALNQRRSTDYTEPTGLARLNWKPVDDLLFYASVSRGIKSGGFTAYNTTDATGIGTQPFQLEKLWAYEIGSKASYDERRIQVNLSGYYYDYSNQQVQSAIVDPQFGLIGKIVNAPSSHILGFESEITWRVTPALTIGQTVGYSNGRYDTFIDVGGSTQDPVTGRYSPVSVNRAGQSLTAPKLTYAGSISYNWDIDDFNFLAGFDYNYRGRYRSHFGTLYDVSSYWLADAHLAITPADGPWQVTLWGRNIFNRTYDVTRNFFVGGDNIALAGEPATYGATVSVKF